MELFIQIRNGQPYEHPIFADNFQQAFPHVDINNLPPGFARFERVPCPNMAGVYEIDEVVYRWDGGIVKDVWSVRPMTAEEKQAKIDEVLARQPFPSWIFHEPTCHWGPPTPYPVDGKRYKWDESITNWVEVTLHEGA
jgi:hypothetical protein